MQAGIKQNTIKLSRMECYLFGALALVTLGIFYYTARNIYTHVGVGPDTSIVTLMGCTSILICFLCKKFDDVLLSKVLLGVLGFYIAIMYVYANKSAVGFGIVLLLWCCVIYRKAAITTLLVTAVTLEAASIANLVYTAGMLDSLKLLNTLLIDVVLVVVVIVFSIPDKLKNFLFGKVASYVYLGAGVIVLLIFVGLSGLAALAQTDYLPEVFRGHTWTMTYSGKNLYMYAVYTPGMIRVLSLAAIATVSVFLVVMVFVKKQQKCVNVWAMVLATMYAMVFANLIVAGISLVLSLVMMFWNKIAKAEYKLEITKIKE